MMRVHLHVVGLDVVLPPQHVSLEVSKDCTVALVLNTESLRQRWYEAITGALFSPPVALPPSAPCVQATVTYQEDAGVVALAPRVSPAGAARCCSRRASASAAASGDLLEDPSKPGLSASSLCAGVPFVPYASCPAAAASDEPAHSPLRHSVDATLPNPTQQANALAPGVPLCGPRVPSAAVGPLVASFEPCGASAGRVYASGLSSTNDPSPICPSLSSTRVAAMADLSPAVVSGTALEALVPSTTPGYTDLLATVSNGAALADTAPLMDALPVSASLPNLAASCDSVHSTSTSISAGIGDPLVCAASSVIGAVGTGSPRSIADCCAESASPHVNHPLGLGAPVPQVAPLHVGIPIVPAAGAPLYFGAIGVDEPIFDADEANPLVAAVAAVAVGAASAVVDDDADY